MGLLVGLYITMEATREVIKEGFIAYNSLYGRLANTGDADRLKVRGAVGGAVPPVLSLTNRKGYRP